MPFPTPSAAQAELLRGADLLQETGPQVLADGSQRRLRLWKTGFKYPLVREEVLTREGKVQRHAFSVADHVMVRFPAGLTEPQAAQWAETHGFQIRQARATSRLRLVALAETSLQAQEKLLHAFESDFPAAPQRSTATPVAEPDWLVFTTETPNDPQFSQLWGLHNRGQTGGVVDADIDAPEAWSRTTGSRESVVVGVIDSGVDYLHEDLAANMWRNPGEILNGKDDDGNGFVDDIHGYDFYQDDALPSDGQSHGTHCAGTIGATGDNQIGVAGVCWKVRLMALRFIGTSTGTTSDAIQCQEYATLMGASLTSNSWGGGGSSVLLQDAIRDAGNANMLFVAAAGNNTRNLDELPHYPAAYSLENIISVAASTDLDELSDFSNYSETQVDLAAPGSSIYSTIPGGYGFKSGTSMAAPHVAGALALALSIRPDEDAQALKTRLLGSVDLLPAFAGRTVTGGRLNLARLLSSMDGPFAIAEVTSIAEGENANGDGVLNPGEAVRVEVTVTNPGTIAAQATRLTVVPAAPGSPLSLSPAEQNVGDLLPGQSWTGTFILSSPADLPTPHQETLRLLTRYQHPESSEELTEERQHGLILHTSSLIQGLVRTETGDAVTEAQVVISGASPVQLSTGEDGRFSALLTDGQHSLTVYASGYLPGGPLELVTPPGSDNLEIVLKNYPLVVAPGTLTETVLRGDVNTREITLTNQGDTPLDWSLARRPAPRAPPAAGGATVLPLRSLLGVRIGQHELGFLRDATWLQELQARGATLVTLDSPLTFEKLADVDVMLVDDSIRSLADGEVGALQARMSQAGLGILSEADDEASLNRINGLFNGTGITARWSGYARYILADIRPHPTTEGVSALAVDSSGYQANLGNTATPLIANRNGGIFAAAARAGRGAIVFVGNEITTEAALAQGDSRRFAHQVIDWLVAEPGWVTTSASSGRLPPGQSTTLEVRLDGTTEAAGQHEANLVFNTNIVGMPDLPVPVRMTLQDSPKVGALPLDRLEFGDVPEQIPATRTFVIHNPGTLPLELGLPEVVATGKGTSPAAFSVAVSGAPVPRGSVATVAVTFSTSAPLGRHEALLKLGTNDPRQPLIEVAMGATRTRAGKVVLTPASTQASLYQGQALVKNLTLKNAGRGPLTATVELLLPAGESWAALRPPPAQVKLAAGKSMRLPLDLAPGALPPGIYKATLRVTSDDAARPVLEHEVALTLSAAAVAAFEPQDFGKVYLGQAGLRSLIVRNVSSEPLRLKAVRGSAGFKPHLLEPVTLALGESAQILVDFTPARTGLIQSTLSISANVPGGLIRVPVSGLGARAPQLKFSPASIKLTTLPGQPLSRTVKVTNTGGEPLEWNAYPALQNGTDWLHVDVPPDSGVLAPGKSALVQVRLETVQHSPGQLTGAIVFGTSNSGHEQTLNLPVSLYVKGGGLVVASPTSLDLGKLKTGDSAPVSFELVNVGNGPALLRGISPYSKDFEFVSLPAEARLQPGQSFHVEGLFKAGSKPRKVKSALTFRISESVLTQARVTVNATVASPANLQVKPAKAEAILAAEGVTPLQLALSNRGGMDLSDLSASVEPSGAADWLVPSLPTMPLKAGASAPLILTLDPRRAASGIQEAVVKISSAADSAITLAIPVRVTVPEIRELTAEPALVTLPTISPNSSASQSVTLQNTGNTPIKLLDLVSDTPELTGTLPGLPQTLQPWTSTTLNVVYSPAGKEGPLEARLMIMAEGIDGALLTLPVRGTTAPLPALKITPDFVHISTHPGLPGTQTIILQNIGEKTLGIMDIIPTGYFAVSSRDAVLTPGQKMPIFVRSTVTGSQNAGTYSGTLTVKSNDAVQPQIEVAATLEYGSSAYLTSDKTVINYGKVQQQSGYHSGFHITNQGNKPALLSVKSRPQGITLDWDSQPKILYANSSIYLGTHLLPQALGEIQESIVLETDNPHQPTLSFEIRAQVVTHARPEINLESLNLEVETGQSATSSVTLSNQGQMPMTWNGYMQGMAAGAWHYTPGSGSLAGGKNVNISLTVNASGLSPGVYSASLKLTTDAMYPNGNVTLPITLQVLPQRFSLSTSQLSTTSLQGQPYSTEFAIADHAVPPTAWQVSSSVDWAVPGSLSGSGSASIPVQYDATLPVGTYTGTLTVSSAASQYQIDLQHHVIPNVYTALQPDLLNQGLLGLAVDPSPAGAAVLVFLQGQTLNIEKILELPAGTVAMDVTTDGRRLYALAGKVPKLIEVDLATRQITRTRSLPTARKIALGSRIQAGRQGILYYSTLAPSALVYAHDFEANIATRTIVLPSGAAPVSLAAPPNGDTLYVQGSYETATQEGAYLAKLQCLPPAQPQLIAQTASVLEPRLPTVASPVLLAADLRTVLAQNQFFSTSDLAGGEQGRLEMLNGEALWNASAYLDVWVTDQRVLRADSGEVIAALPAGTQVSAFLPDQSRLIYQHPDQPQLGVVETAFLPPPGVRPELPDGGLVGLNHTALQWTCDPSVASYDVYFGSDAQAVQQATIGSPSYFRVSTPAGSWPLPADALAPGQSYAWRIDRRSLDNAVTPGPVWTFRVAEASLDVTEVDARAIPGGSAGQRVQITAEATLPWSLKAEAPWLTLSAAAGQGSASVQLTFNATGLAPGTHETLLTLTRGEDRLSVPVRLVVREPLQIVKMLADPVEPVVYALHRDLSPPYASWLLRVEPGSGQILEERWAGDGALDLAATAGNHLLYILSDHGRRIRLVSRGTATTGPEATALPLAPPQSRLCLPSPSTMVTTGPSNDIYLRHAANGQVIFSGSPLPRGQVTLTAASGGVYSSVALEGQSETQIRQWSTASNKLTQVASDTVAGSVALPLSVTETGRLFYRRKTWHSLQAGWSDLAVNSDVLAVSPGADRGITRTTIYDISGEEPVQLSSLPQSAEVNGVALAPADAHGQRWLLLYDPAQRRFIPVALP